MTTGVVKTLKEWRQDWIGRSAVAEESGASNSPFQALAAALGVIAIIFSDTVVKAVTKDVSARAVGLIRIGILLLLILMAHYTVVAKIQHAEDAPDRQAYKYKYSQYNRLISKFVALIGLAIVIWLLWPQPAPCPLKVSISGSKSDAILYLEISGGDEKTRVALTGARTALFEITPKQVGHWSLTLFDKNGHASASHIVNGCPKKEMSIKDDFGSIVLQPS